VELFGDPDRLYALASKIASEGEVVRAQASRLRRHAGEVPWKSVGADAFRARVEGNVNALLAAAAAMDAAAAALRHHADAVRSHLSFLRDVAERAVDIGEGLVKDAGGVIHRLTDGPWW
jgi:phage-related minor tail protein